MQKTHFVSYFIENAFYGIEYLHKMLLYIFWVREINLEQFHLDIIMKNKYNIN